VFFRDGRLSNNKRQFERNFYKAFPSAEDPHGAHNLDLFEDLEAEE